MAQTRLALVVLGTAAALGAGPAAAARSAPSAPARAHAQPPDGAKVYSATCAACHQANGEGVPDRYPPLAGSEWVVGDQARLARIVLHGLTGEVDVQGETYNGAMPGWAPTLNDADLAAVLTYVRGNFGNKAAPVTAATIAQLRAATKSRTTPWTVGTLQAAASAHE